MSHRRGRTTRKREENQRADVLGQPEHHGVEIEARVDASSGSESFRSRTCHVIDASTQWEQMRLTRGGVLSISSCRPFVIFFLLFYLRLLLLLSFPYVILLATSRKLLLTSLNFLLKVET